MAGTRHAAMQYNRALRTQESELKRCSDRHDRCVYPIRSLARYARAVAWLVADPLDPALIATAPSSFTTRDPLSLICA